MNTGKALRSHCMRRSRSDGCYYYPRQHNHASLRWDWVIMVVYGFIVCGITITCTHGFLRPGNGKEHDGFNRKLGEEVAGKRNGTGSSHHDSFNYGLMVAVVVVTFVLSLMLLIVFLWMRERYWNVKEWWKRRKFYQQEYPFHFRILNRAGLSVSRYENTMPDIKRIMKRLYWRKDNGEPMRVDEAVETEQMEKDEFKTLVNTLADALVMNKRWRLWNYSWCNPKYWIFGRCLPKALTEKTEFRNSIRCEWKRLFHRSHGNLEDVPSTCIFRDEFEIGENIVKGVYMGRWEESKEQIAVKVLSQSSGNDGDNDTAQYNPDNEATTHLQLCHPNVLTLYGYCRDSKTQSHYLLMEYQPKGTLSDRLEEKDLPWFTKEQIAIEIADGLAYLHRNNIIHRDMKSLNILLDDEYHPKLCDFGFSKTLAESSNRYAVEYQIGSHRWMSPEAFMRGEKEGGELRCIDVYALGIIMWELCTRQIPKTKSRVHSPDKFPDEGYPPRFVEQAKACCRKDPTCRPSAEEVAKELRKAPVDIMSDVFPEGTKTSHLLQGNVDNCRHVASLHSLKKNPLAPQLFQRLITEKSKIDAGQNVWRIGWRVHFSFPFDKRPVDVHEANLDSTTIGDVTLKVLQEGQPGYKILLLAASRWRKLYGTTNSVLTGTPTIVQGEHTNDPNEFFRLCLCESIEYPIDVFANNEYDSLSTLDTRKVYQTLNQFSDEPQAFLLTAGTRGQEKSASVNATSVFADATRPLLSKADGEAKEERPPLYPKHMYSILATNRKECTVTLADPSTTNNVEFTLHYDTFVEEFRRLSGVKLKHETTKCTPS